MNNQDQSTAKRGADSVERMVSQRRKLKAKLKLLNKTISKAQEAAKPAPAESGKRGNQPMPKPQNKQAIIATVKWHDGALTGIYWRGTTGGGWKREFFVVDGSGDRIPWRRVMSWRKLANSRDDLRP